MKLTSLFLMLLLLLTTGASASPSWSAVVLHTNDTHGQLFPMDDDENLGGVARRATLVARERARAAINGTPLLLVDAGDINTGTFESDQALGLVDIAAMNAIGYDAAAIGNHEFDLLPPDQEAFLKAANFPMLSANTRRYNFFRAFSPATTLVRDGKRILLVGLTAEETPQVSTFARDYRHRFTDGGEELERVLRRQDPAPDFVVVLSHLGRTRDLELIPKFAGRVQAWVGGHTHFQELVQVDETTVYTRAGSKGRWLGRFHLGYRNGRPAAYSPEVLTIAPTIPEDPEVAALLPPLTAGEVLVSAAGPLSKQPLEGLGSSTPIGNFYTDALRAETGVDIAVANQAGIRRGLPAGPITDKQLYGVCPFKNKAWVYRLTGAQVLELFRDCVSLGVPGPGFLEVSGARVRWHQKDPKITVGGRPLQLSARYTLAVSDFLAKGGDGYTAFARFPKPERIVTTTPAAMLQTRARELGRLIPDRAVRHLAPVTGPAHRAH